MAFGFPAHYETRIEPYVDRRIARDTIGLVLDNLGWAYQSPHPDLFVARVPVSGFSWGEKVSISFSEQGDLEVRSVCNGVFPQIFDWGKNKKNVDTFLELFSAKAPRISTLSEPQGSAAFDVDGKTPLQRAFAADEPSDQTERS